MKEYGFHTVQLKALFGCLLAGVLYYGLARFGMAVLLLQPSNVSLLWLPSGLALVMCLRWGAKAIPFIIAASAAVNYPAFAHGNHLLFHLSVSAVADALSGWLAMLGFRKFLPLGLARTRDLLLFGLWVCLLPNLVSSLLISANIGMGGYLAWSDFAGFLAVMCFGDCLGTLLVFPVYQGWTQRLRLTALQVRWLFTIAVAILGVFALAALGEPAFIFLVGPALLLLAFNTRLLTFSSVSVVTVVLLVSMTTIELGPFVTQDTSDTNLRLAVFAFSIAVVTLGVGLQRQELNHSEFLNQVWQNAAKQDVLTGLGNRRAFIPLLEHEHQRALRTGRPYTLAAVDLDHFKKINDTFGHATGDEALKTFADLMQLHCRVVDTIGRIGGEEFAILLPECSTHDALTVLERLRVAQENAHLASGGKKTTVSMGVASFSGNGLSATEIFALADKSLYIAKTSGRNCIVVDESV